MIDFSDFIADRSKGFSGREWVFNEIDAWLVDPEAPSFFIITGEPGVGKSAIAARLAQTRDLAACHFCIARQIDTTDPLTFVRSLSLQLAERCQPFAQALTQVGHAQINVIKVSQKVTQVASGGEVKGVVIQNLVLGNIGAQEAFVQTVLSPLKAIAGSLEQPLVILVDALDEAVQRQENVTIVHLLASAGGLPGRVRIVLTSRPEGAAMRHFSERQVPRLLLDASRAENQADIRAHIVQQLDSSDDLQARLAEQKMPREAFIERIAAACKGNFLYLTWLLPAIASGVQHFDRLEALPAGLDGIYREFLRTRIIGDTRTWRDYRPLLGTLTVAQVPLTPKQLSRFSGMKLQAAADFIVDAEQFLDPLLAQAGRYLLYHQSLIDFLHDQERAGEFWIDSYACHAQIIDSIRGSSRSWGDIDWSAADEYSIRYLTNHLFALRSAAEHSGDLESSGAVVVRAALFELTNREYMRAKYKQTGSHSAFAADVDRAIQVARQERQPDLLQVIRACVLFPTLASLSANASPRLLGALARLDYEGLEAALGIIWLIQDPSLRAWAFITVASQLPDGAPESERLKILNGALKAAERVGDLKTRAELLLGTAQACVEADEQEQGRFALDQALALVEQFEDAKTRTNMQVWAAYVAEKLGEYGKALAAAEAIQDAEARAQALLQLVEALMASGDFEAALNVIERAIEAAESSAITIRKISLLIQAGDSLMQLGKGELADNILNRASELAEEAEEVGFDWQLRLELAKAGKSNQASELLSEAISYEDRDVTTHFGEAPHVWTDLAYRLVLAEDRKQVGDAVEQALTETLKYRNTDGSIWTLIDAARVCHQAGEIVSTRRFLEIIQAQAMQVGENDERKIEYLIELAQLYEATGEQEGYQSLLARIVETAEGTDDIRIVYRAAQSLAEAGRDEQSRRLLARLPETIENVDTLCDIAQLLNRLGEGEKARRLINQALIREEINKLQDFQQEEAALKSHILASAGDIDQSLQSAKGITDPVLQAQTMCWIIRSAFQRGAGEKALAAYDQASRLAKRLAENPKGRPILSRLSEIMALAGQHGRALEAASWVEYADEAAQTRDGKEAGSKWAKHDTSLWLMSVANDHCSSFLALHQSAAQRLAIQRSSLPQEIYSSLEQAFLAEIRKSYALLDTALDTAEGIDGVLIKAKALLDVAEAYSRARLYEQELGLNLAAPANASASIERAVSAVEQIKDRRYRALALNALIPVLEKAGKLDQIQMLVSRISDISTEILAPNEASRAAPEEERPSPYPSAGMPATWRIEQIMRTAEGIENPEDRVQFFCNTAQALVLANRREDARLLFVQALDLARTISREAVLQVLFTATGWIHEMESFEYAWRIHESVVEIDGWWILE